MVSIRVNQRPILQVHVGISDQGIEYQPPDELDNACLTRLGPENLGDIAIACSFVLAFRVHGEYLGKVLDVNALAVCGSVEALNHVGMLADGIDPGGETGDAT